MTERKGAFWIFGIFMTMGILLHSSLYLLNIYPVTEGWGIYYAELLNRGQMPYRDFYYYLPPVALLIDWVIWRISFGSLLMFRIWYVIQRVFIAWLLFAMLTKWFPSAFSGIACLTGSILRTAVRWDLGGDYNQTQTLLVLLLMYTIVCFLEKDSDWEKESAFRYKYIFLAGFLIAITVLTKQSTGLSALLVCFCFLVAYCITFQDNHFVQYCIATAIGALIPLGICCVFLGVNNALVPFLEQIFNIAGAKGGIFTILFAGWGTILASWDMLLLFIILTVVVCSAYCASTGKTHPIVLLAAVVIFLYGCLICCGKSLAALATFFMRNTTFSVAVCILVAFVGGTILTKNKGIRQSIKLEGKYEYLGLMFVLFVGTFVFLRMNPNNITTNLYNNTMVCTVVPIFCVYFSIYASLFLLAGQFIYYSRCRKLLYPKTMMFLFAGGLVESYANMMNASSDVYPIAVYISFSALVCVLFSLDMNRWTRTKNIILCTLCVLICGSVMIQKYTIAYSWWGSSDTYTLEERSEKVDIEEMTGIKVAPQSKLEFEQVVKLIEENDNENSTVWGFPHIKIFNVLTQHYNTEDPVPVVFYDVCSDAGALLELNWLKENNPEIVIWCDMPGCMESNEIMFRDGEALGQRQIVNWFVEIKDEAYIKIGQVGNLFVYKLDNGEPINYSFFQDPHAVNSTAGEYLQ